MRNICIILFLGIFTIINAQQKQTNYSVVDISIPTRDSIALQGILAIPFSFNTTSPVVIFVAAPQPIDRNYNDLYSNMADSLARNGIASLRFDNRAFADSISTKTNPDKYTMFDTADDVHDIYLWLRKDKRFTNSPIGLLGHSEGGASCAIETSRNKDIAFLIVLSTMGLTGNEIAFYQATLFTSYLSSESKSDERNNTVNQIYDMLNIIDKYPDKDSIGKHLRDYLDNVLTTSLHSQKELEKLTKKIKTVSKEETIDRILKDWMTPRKLCYFKYIPELYYSKIKCPALVICGIDDERIEWKSNLDAIERIFIENNKQNYKIVAIEGVNHSFEETYGIKIPAFISVRKKDPHKKEWGKGFQQLNRSIYKWINKLR